MANRRHPFPLWTLLLAALVAAFASAAASAADVKLDDLIAGLRRAEAALAHAEYSTTTYRGDSATGKPFSSADFYRHGDQIKTVRRFGMGKAGTNETYKEQVTVVVTPDLAIVKLLTKFNPQLFRGALLQRMKEDRRLWGKEVELWIPDDPFFVATAGSTRSGSGAAWLEAVLKNPDLVITFGDSANLDFWPKPDEGAVDLRVAPLPSKRKPTSLDCAVRLIPIGSAWVVSRYRAFDAQLVVRDTQADYDYAHSQLLPTRVVTVDSKGTVSTVDVKNLPVSAWKFQCGGSASSCSAAMGLADAGLTKFDIVNDRNNGTAEAGVVFAGGELVPYNEFLAAGGLADESFESPQSDHSRAESAPKKPEPAPTLAPTAIDKPTSPPQQSNSPVKILLLSIGLLGIVAASILVVKRLWQ